MKHPDSSLDTWARPHFQPGGGDAFLFYVVYGSVDADAPLSRSAYRCAGIPDALKVMRYGPTVHPETVDSFRSGYLWDELGRTESELASKIADQKSCVVLQGGFSDPKTLDYLRDTVGLVTHFLDHGGVAVHDPQMFVWWSPKKWKERIFTPAGPVPRHHTVILVSEDAPGTEWIHTRGLRKFGRPDVSIHRVPPSLKQGVIDLCNRFIELQAFGGIVAEGQEIRIGSLPPGMICHHRGDPDDPEFNNVHLEIGRELNGEPDGAANGSQPIRSETNSTSSAAGSRR
jgi:hypothetical protein